MPTWTEIGGFWVGALGFALAIALAIVGWVQARGAKAEAKVAKEHADAAQEQATAAKKIAGEAKRQTAAAEAAAEAAQQQAEAAIAALHWETVPQLVVVATKRYNQSVIDGSVRRQVMTSDWFVVNTGKAAAIRLSVRLHFGSDTQISPGPNNFLRLDPGERSLLSLYGVPFPAFEDLLGAGYKPTARLKYDTPTGQPKDETVVVLPYEQS